MTGKGSDPLLETLQLGPVRLKNRIFSSGHALSHAQAGRPTDTTLRYQMEKAKGGIGLSFVGGSGTVSPDTAPVFDQLIIDHDIIPFFAELADFYHRHGAALMTQITHLGRRTNANAGDWLPIVAPSANREILHRGFPRAMDEADILRIVGDFATAARICREAGLDGLEIIASGHLMDQFWSPVTNQRTDCYGGSLDNRMRYSRMVFEAMREAAGPDFALGVRMTMTEQDHDKSGLSEEDNIEIASRLRDDGTIDFLNLVSGRIDTLPRLTSYMPGMATPLSPFLAQAGRFRREIGLPILHATRINDLATARHAASQAFATAGVSVGDVDLAEVHDCFTITEVLMYEAMGMAEKGQGGALARSGHTALDGKLPVNTGGGLIGFGHPVGATGVKQPLEIYRQMKGRCGDYQLSELPQLGMTMNMGGDDKTVVSLIMRAGS